MAEQIHFVLNTGAKMPAVGLGTWQAEPGQVAAAIATALEAGYRHIDCAALYANEPEIGQALADAFAKGVVKREDLFITSKLWLNNFAADKVLPGLEKTLSDLQLEYVDLYLLHHPIAMKRVAFPPTIDDFDLDWDVMTTWRELEKAHKKGLVKAIGVSNWTVKKLETLLAGKPEILPAVNQVEAHPIWRQDKLFPFCKANSIHLSAYSPLGSTARWALLKHEGTPEVLTHPVVVDVAAKLGKTPAQVVLRWGVQRGTSVLPKSTNPDRIRQNLDVFGWSLPEEDFKALDSIEPQIRFFDFNGLWVGKDFPWKTLEVYWDGEI